MVYAPLVAHVVLKMLFPGDLQMGELLKDPVDMGLWITLVAYASKLPLGLLKLCFVWVISPPFLLRKAE